MADKICSSCLHIHVSPEHCNYPVEDYGVCACYQDPVVNQMVETEAKLWENPPVISGSYRNPHLNKILSKIAEIHDKKNHDYCPDDSNPFFNFEVAGKYADTQNGTASLVLGPIDSFNILLGVKLARLYALLTRGAAPNNEAFIDSEWDYVVYFLLRESYKLKMEEEKTQISQ